MRPYTVQNHSWIKANLLLRTNVSEICIKTPISFSRKCIWIWVRSRRWAGLVAWFCYQMIAKPGNKTASPLRPDPYVICKMATILLRPPRVNEVTQLTSFTWHPITLWVQNYFFSVIQQMRSIPHLDGLVQERCNSSALAMELGLKRYAQTTIRYAIWCTRYDMFRDTFAILSWEAEACDPGLRSEAPQSTYYNCLRSNDARWLQQWRPPQSFQMQCVCD